MNPSDIVLLALEAMGGPVQGKTLAQKRLYFMAVLAGYEDALDYRPHYYGPYSAVVADAVGQNVSLGFVRQERTAYGAADPRGFEVARTDYALTRDGREVAHWMASQDPEVRRKLEAAWRRIYEAGDLDYMTLSVAAKIHHLLPKNGVPVRPEDLRESARCIGWELPADGIEKAVRFLQALAFVKI